MDTDGLIKPVPLEDLPPAIVIRLRGGKCRLTPEAEAVFTAMNCIFFSRAQSALEHFTMKLVPGASSEVIESVNYWRNAVSIYKLTGSRIGDRFKTPLFQTMYSEALSHLRFSNESGPLRNHHGTGGIAGGAGEDAAGDHSGGEELHGEHRSDRDHVPPSRRSGKKRTDSGGTSRKAGRKPKRGSAKTK